MHDSPAASVEVPTGSQLVRATAQGVLLSLALATVKLATGIVGHSNALIADGIESVSDAVTSVVVLLGIRVASRPPDEEHPYGHGRAETLAALVVALALLGAAALIAWRSIHEIAQPHEAPAWFTLPVLVGVIVVKGLLSWRLSRLGRAAGSPAVQGDSLHHASDALTSVAAFVGISVALLAGPGWESADDWAALAACGIIAGNAVFLARGALRELMDEAADPALERQLRAIAAATPGVLDVEKSRVRRSGAGYLMDIHIEVDAHSTVREGHDIAGAVKQALLRAGLRVSDVVVHVEPWNGLASPKDKP